MKKYIRFFSILPILLLSILCFWGCSCSEEKVQRVTISVEEGENVTVTGSKKYTVVWGEEYGDYVQIDATVYPEGFGLENLSWRSSNTSIGIFRNNNGLLTCLGEGEITITATYGNTGVSDTIFVTLIRATSTRFPQDYASCEYTGQDVKDNYKVINASQDSENYFYRYVNNFTGDTVSEIKDVGEYSIYYYQRIEDGTSSVMIDQMTVEITPRKIIKTAENGSSKFGASLQQGFYNIGDVSDNLIEQNGYNMLDGVGDDASEIIGKYVHSTNATQNSNAGSNYQTYFEYVLYDEFANNYEIISASGIYEITAREVVLQVEDQDITYMSRPRIEAYSLYDYTDYVNNGNSINGLTKLEGNLYTDCIEVGSSYAYYKNNEVVGENKYGYLDAGNYEIGYTSATPNNNLRISLILRGELSVARRSVEITPDSELSKRYGEADNLSALTYTTSSNIIEDEVNPFLTIDYASNLDSDFILSQNNTNAPVGRYYYLIDSTKNQNYNFSLVSSALPDYENEEDAIMFTVTQSSVEIQFEDYNGNYIKPIEATGHSASYYQNANVDFVLTIKSFLVNGIEMVQQDGSLSITTEDFASTGLVEVPTGEIFRVDLRLLPDVVQEGFFVTYKVGFERAVFDNGLETNYDINVLSSYISLRKIKLTIKPKETVGLNTKVYDNTADLFGINNFLTDYDVFGNLEEGIEIEDIVSDKTLLSLTNQNGYFVKNSNGNKSEVLTFKDVGKYQVFLSSNIVFLDGMEYYELSLDNSKEYYFEVTKKDIKIIPDSNQGKIYGNADGELTYQIDITTEVYEGDGSPRDGSLTRIQGEDVGEYEIILGTLSFGNNYNLIVQTGVNYSISKREVEVVPYDYTTTYGDNNPTTISRDTIISGEYDKDILVEPEFEGEFSLNYNNVVINKVGGFYPVQLDEDGSIVSYSIKKGSFDLTETSSKNYQLTVNESSTFTVNPKEIVINIRPTNRNTEDGEPGENIELSLDANFSVAPGLAGDAEITIIVNSLQKSEGMYLVAGLDDLTISITLDNSNVNECYSITLGENVLYYVNSELIGLKIVAKGTNESNVERTFDGESMQDEFELVSTNSKYILSQESTYTIVFSTTQEEGVEPINVGGYSVSLVLNEGQEIIILNSTGEEVVRFSSFGVSTNGYVASLSQSGYLTINKASIDCNRQGLGFVSSLTYGSDETQLPNLKINADDGTPIFKGVDGSAITLRTYESGKNFQYRSSTYPISMLGVSSSHEITVLVQAVNENNELDNNYQSLTIEVPLTITPKEIVIVDTPSLEPVNQTEVIEYNGASRYFALNISTEDDDKNYSITYRYILFETIYDSNSETPAIGMVKKYNLSADNIVTPVTDAEGEIVTIMLEELMSKLASGVSIQNIGGNYYVVVNSDSSVRECYRINQREDVTPRNAGIYMVTGVVSANQNYILSYNDTVNNSFEFSTFFEIQKSDDIVVENWRENFYYGTIFNVGIVENLPFEYNMEPNYKNSVQYITPDLDAWNEVGFVLNVGTYTITLLVNDENYYYKSDFTFNVNSLQAEFIFPADNRFTYKGENQPIVSFLDNISVVLKDMYGNNTQIIEYDAEDADMFNFEYYEVEPGGVEIPCDGVPYDVGVYVLKATYGDKTSSYYGEGEFEYEIIKKTYSGYVKATDKQAIYNPDYTADDIYSIMLTMFETNANASTYSITICDDNNPDLVFTPDDESWVKAVNTCTTRRIKFVMHFYDGLTADREIRANLTFTRIAITQDSLRVVSNMEDYDYTGNPVYKQLLYYYKNEGVDLSPGIAGESTSVTAGGSNFTIEYLENNTLNLNDSLGNLVLTLAYTYYIYTDDTVYQATTIPPTAPHDFKYRVEYEIKNVGTNYERSLSNVNASEFYIRKINALYISVSTFTHSYTGENLANLITDADIIVANRGSSTKTNMKVTILYNPQVGAPISYSETQGVCLIVRYQRNGITVSEIKNAGGYQIILSFLYLPTTYKLSKYFTTIYFNGVPYSVDTFSSGNPSTLIYDNHLQTTFTVDVAENPYDSNNFEEALNIEGYYDIKLIDGIRTLVINDNTKITKKSDVHFSFKFYSANTNPLDISSFEALPAPYEVGQDYIDYNFAFVDDAGNYSSSNLIRVRKEKVANPYDESNFEQALDISGSGWQIKEENGKRILYFNNSSQISIKNDVEFVIKFYSEDKELDYSYFVDLPAPSGDEEYVEYRIVFYDEDGHYGASDFITIRKTRT